MTGATSVFAHAPVASAVKADCYAVQSADRVAVALGSNTTAADELKRLYGQSRQEQALTLSLLGYTSPKCVENGPWDLTPNDGVWP